MPHSKLFLVLASPLASFVLTSCGGEAHAASEPDRSLRVEVAVVSTQDASERIVLHGVVEGSTEARLAFTVGGRLVQRTVEVGDRVQAGQVLANLDARPYQNAVRAAEAQLSALRSQRQQSGREETRAEALFAEGAIGEASVEGARTGAAALSANEQGAGVQLRELQRQRNEAVLRAPRGGVVTAVFVDPGTVVSPGTPIVALSADGERELWVRAPARWAQRLSPSQPAEIVLGGDGRSVAGTVLSVSSAADGSGLFPVRIALPEGGAVGEGAIAYLEGTVLAELRVPLRAIVDPSGSRPFLWRVGQDDVVRRVEVEVGALRDRDGGDRSSDRNSDDRNQRDQDASGPQVALESGDIQAGDRVVVSGQRQLFDGDTVVVR